MHYRGSPGSLLLCCSLLVACGPRPTRVEDARALVRQGKLAEGCAAARRLIAHGRGRAERLAAVRCWVDCLARAGRLAAGEAGLAGQPAPLRGYGEALLAVARSPAKVDAAVAKLAQVAGRWPGEAEPAYRAGLLLLADDQARRALPWLQRACRAAETPACRVLEGHALLDLGQPARALAAARRVAELGPTPADLRRGRALIQRLARRRRNLPRAVAARYRKALDQLTKQQRPSAAVAAAQELLLDHPQLPALHTLLGLAQLKLGNTAEAIVALRRAAELDSADPVNHLYLATLYEGRASWTRCVEQYRQALRFDPFDLRATAGLARALRKAGQLKEAARVLDRLVVLERRSDRSLRLAGRAHLAARSFDGAMAHFRQLLAKTPSDFEAHLRLAQALLELHSADGDETEAELLNRARHHADRAAAVRPKDPELQQIEKRLERYMP